MTKKIILSLWLIISLQIVAFSQNNTDKKNYAVTCIGFYNLENLFDTIVDPDTTLILQDDFTSKGPKRWNTPKYYEKLGNMARVISELGTEVTPDGAAILGVAEVENKSVLEDLVKQDAIKNRNYQIVHFDSPDKRGIDVGLLYNPNYFKNVSAKSYTLSIPTDSNFFTRSQLLVSGELHGEKIHVIVAHWPSRRGGEKRSKPKRIAAAQLARAIIDSLQQVDPNTKVLYMGDLNDDPVDVSVRGYLKAVGTKEEANNGKLYNPFEDFFKKGIGTLGYQDAWNLFDQIIVSHNFLNYERGTHSFAEANIFDEAFLAEYRGKYKGYPRRTYVGSRYMGGFSDHFPVYVQFKFNS